MLYGLAVETALKAYLIEHFPDKVEIAVVADGTGRATKASIRQIGAHPKDGHNLYKLAVAAEILTADNFDGLQIKVLHGLLRHLAQMVQWQSRYPVPLASGEQFYLGDAIPDDLKRTEPKPWIDMILDKCLETPAP